MAEVPLYKAEHIGNPQVINSEPVISMKKNQCYQSHRVTNPIKVITNRIKGITSVRILKMFIIFLISSLISP